MNEIKNCRKEVSWSSTICLSILIILTEIPAINRYMGGYFVYIPVIILLFLSLMSRTIAIDKNNALFFIVVLTYCFIAFFYKLVGVSSAHFGHDIHFVLYYTYFLAIDTVINMDNKKRNFILFILFISLIYTIVSNIVMLYDLGSTQYFRLHHIEEDINLKNLASTQFSSGVVLICGILEICVLSDKIKKRRVIWFVLLMICLTFNIFIAQRTINIILTICMTLLILINNNPNTLRTKVTIVIIATIITMILLNIDYINGFISRIDKLGRVSERVNQIIVYLSKGDIQDAGGSLEARYNLFMRSIKTWLFSWSSFIFGVGDHINDNSIIGNHSQFIDVFAQYGLVGGMMLIYTTLKSVSILIGKLGVYINQQIRQQIIIVFAMFLIRGLIGYVLYEQIAVSLFVLLPAILLQINEGGFKDDSIYL